ncbi:MAG: Rad52/22 family double-strand break repair protein-domain-containing protein [Olpidium bornovanus]|uniref:Rad52/22 family double-strand break repair protein-domain-containing protein n=1 Tax=Olpidium bornovanus TaxID=278681 RepID=A0A8H7ZPD6_9FUNG|nr:MAG: Rad52/22 family double-strand break repair protein-domain-containing protein [Olpidium bornovanus]
MLCTSRAFAYHVPGKLQPGRLIHAPRNALKFDESSAGRFTVGISCVIRVTVKDGAFREDIGYGQAENVKGKGSALEKAKKEAVTDGLKRCFRQFGDCLGNCVYDKAFLQQLSKFNPQKVGGPCALQLDSLHRAPGFGPPPVPPNVQHITKSTAVSVVAPHPAQPQQAQANARLAEDTLKNEPFLGSDDSFGGKADQMFLLESSAMIANNTTAIGERPAAKLEAEDQDTSRNVVPPSAPPAKAATINQRKLNQPDVPSPPRASVAGSAFPVSCAPAFPAKGLPQVQTAPTSSCLGGLSHSTRGTNSAQTTSFGHVGRSPSEESRAPAPPPVRHLLYPPPGEARRLPPNVRPPDAATAAGRPPPASSRQQQQQQQTPKPYGDQCARGNAQSPPNREQDRTVERKLFSPLKDNRNLGANAPPSPLGAHRQPWAFRRTETAPAVGSPCASTASPGPPGQGGVPGLARPPVLGGNLTNNSNAGNIPEPSKRRRVENDWWQ